jgi:alcohol dehydrogenase class IV
MLFPKEFYFPEKTLFEVGSIAHLAREVASFGERGVVLYGPSLEKDGKRAAIKKSLAHLSVEYVCRVPGEPTLDEITLLIQRAHAHKAEWIVGIGGGSVLDVAKATAGLFRASHPPVYYQEGGLLEEPGLPFIAVPTTAGTGSEATSNAVIINPAKKVKLSIRDKSFLPRKVILDSALLEGIPRSILLYSALDAYVQSYESFVSRGATWFTETLALKALAIIDSHIIGAVEGENADDRNALLLASYLAGVAFHSSRLGVIHGVAHPLGALYEVPHGLVCAVSFPIAIKINQDSIGEKYDVLSETVNRDFYTRVTELLEKFALCSPFKGKKIIDKDAIIEATLTSGSTLANPKKITADDVEVFLKELF